MHVAPRPHQGSEKFLSAVGDINPAVKVQRIHGSRVFAANETHMTATPEAQGAS